MCNDIQRGDKMRQKLMVLCLALIMAWIPVPAIPVFGAPSSEASYGVDADFPPFSFVANGAPQGFETDLLNLIFESGDYRLNMKLGYTWDEIYNGTRDGKLDICGTLVRTPKRAEEVLFTEDAYTRYYGVFTRDTDEAMQIDKLTQYKLGAVKGYYSEIIVRDELKASQYEVFDTYEDMITALIEKRIDAFIESTEVVKYYLEKDRLVGQVILKHDGLYPASVPFGVSKSRPELVKFINSRLNEIKASGEYEIVYIKNFSTHSKAYYDGEKHKLVVIISGVIAAGVILQIGIQLYIRHLRKKIIRSQGFSKGIVDNAAVAIILWNLEGKLINFNHTASVLTGYAEHEVAGDRWRELLFKSSDPLDSQGLLDLVKVHDINVQFKANLTCRDGSIKSILFTSAAIGEDTDGNKVVATYGTDVSDILDTKRRLSETIQIMEENGAELEESNALLEEEVRRRAETESKLITALDAAEAAAVVKDHFLANMSHEIRTPMNGFMGMLQLLKLTNLTDEQQEYLQFSESSANALLAVVNDIMDYSKIEAGGMVLDNQAFDIKRLMKEMTSLFSASARIKGIKLTYKIEPGVPEHLLGDVFKLKQILSNLIGNAIKFTSVGSVEIEVERTSSTNAENVRLEFCVRDTGIGIQEDKRSMIFDRFTQVDGSHSREFGGTGLGLAISKGLVELMNGRIWVDCSGESGSAFHFTCDLMENHSIEQEGVVISSSELQGTETKALRILVAEDDPISRLLIERIGRRQGWDMISAENGEIAVELFKTRYFDAVLMDIQMPVMDGYEATRIIREIEGERKHTRIIALTAHALHNDDTKCFEAGMDAYMTKPINVSNLIEVLSHHTRPQN